MTLLIHCDERELTVGLSAAGGKLVARRLATWRVGGGQSLASHIGALLAVAAVDSTAIRQLSVSLQSSSLTTLRSCLVFANSFTWVLGIPLLTVARPVATIDELARHTARGATTRRQQLFPTYDPE